jgi:hypothetical protein
VKIELLDGATAVAILFKLSLSDGPDEQNAID